jgi:hypothetical protein
MLFPQCRARQVQFMVHTECPPFRASQPWETFRKWTRPCSASPPLTAMKPFELLPLSKGNPAIATVSTHGSERSDTLNFPICDKTTLWTAIDVVNRTILVTTIAEQ